MLHHNVLITNNTTFNEYYDLVRDHIIDHHSNLRYEFDVESIPVFEVLVWIVDDLRNQHINLSKGTLSAYKSKKLDSNFGLQKDKVEIINNKLGIREFSSSSSISKVKGYDNSI